MPLWGEVGSSLLSLNPQREYVTCRCQPTTEERPKVMKGELCSGGRGSQAMMKAGALVFGPHKGPSHSLRLGFQAPFSQSVLHFHTN